MKCYELKISFTSLIGKHYCNNEFIETITFVTMYNNVSYGLQSFYRKHYLNAIYSTELEEFSSKSIIRLKIMM